MLRQINSTDGNFEKELHSLLNRHSDASVDIDSRTRKIIADVKARGDQSLIELTNRFDGLSLSVDELELPRKGLQEALAAISNEQRQALDFAAKRIRDYHLKQKQESWDYQEESGTVLGQKITPLDKAGLYVPGGKASYPSSVLMNAIPAKVAGVKELLMVTPTPEGKLNNMVLAAAEIAGVDRVFRIGGAQAIAALAFGTETIPKVDKITGPGNAYVASAKKQVFGQVGIDMLAGPSEVLIIADASVSPDWVAMDLFAQAEHDEMAQAILLTSDPVFAEAVRQSVARLIKEMPRKEIIEASLKNNGAIIRVDSDAELIKVADLIAAEHLEIFTENADDLASKISHAGAIFIGPYSAESLGDYCAGPNHVLPTSGTARFSSPLGVYDFQKRTSIIKASQEGAQDIARNAAIIAESEELVAHAQSAKYRLKN